MIIAQIPKSPVSEATIFIGIRTMKTETPMKIAISIIKSVAATSLCADVIGTRFFILIGGAFEVCSSACQARSEIFCCYSFCYIFLLNNMYFVV